MEEAGIFGVIELGCSPGSFLAPCGAYLPGSGTERVGENEEVSISWVIFGVALKYGKYEVCFHSGFPGHLSLGLCLFPCIWKNGTFVPKPVKVWVLAQRNQSELVLALSSRPLSWGWGGGRVRLGMSQGGPEGSWLELYQLFWQCGLREAGAQRDGFLRVVT